MAVPVVAVARKRTVRVAQGLRGPSFPGSARVKAGPRSCKVALTFAACSGIIPPLCGIVSGRHSLCRPTTKERSMLRPRLAGCALFALGVALSGSGCLSLGLGGRTTYVQESPETSARVSALETRVSALEQAFSLTSATSGTMPAALP
jgi:hypothetical protein